MIYALVATNLAWAAFAAFLVSRGLTAFKRYVALQDAREDTLRDKSREREDQLLNRIQAPQIAVAQSLPDEEPMYIPAFDDETLAREEAERFKIRAD